MKFYRGIDVSLWNGTIDWPVVAKSGISFVMIKTSQGRMPSYNAPFKDPRFDEYIKGASQNGIPVGTYHYFCARNKEEALEEARFFAEAMKPYKDKIDLWAAIDVEDEGFLGAHSKSSLTECIEVFCEHVRSAGFRPIIYSSTWWFNNKFDAGNYPIWEANISRTTRPNRKNLRMWQFTFTGSVNGVAGDVDMNTIYIEGDVNGDGQINLADVSLIMKKIANWDVDINIAEADVNQDGKINLADVSALMKKIAKWDSAKSYTVKSGDSLWAIAQETLGDGNRWKEIAEANNLKDSTIHPGQELIIP